MRSHMKKSLFALLSLALVAAAVQAAEPFAVQVWGNFKQMAHTGNTDGVITVSDLGSAQGTYGVGAMAGMRGELLLWDGRMLVSRGHSLKGETEPATMPIERCCSFEAMWQPGKSWRSRTT